MSPLPPASKGDMPTSDPKEVEAGIAGIPDPALSSERSSEQPIDPAMEAKIVRKFDLILIPTLAVMYLFNSIDKSSLGNAKTNGFTEDLGFVGNQYNILMTTFYIPLIVCCPPVNLLAKKYGPGLVLPLEMLVFGAMATLCAATTTFGGIVAVRLVLGAAESAFLPGVIFYLTTFYTRTELARRLCTFYAAYQIAGAFNGLIAFGVFQIRDGGALRGWQYLFVIEGSATFVAGLLALLILPRSAATAYFLSDAQRGLARRRLELDSSSEVDAAFSLRAAGRAFTQDALWVAYGAIGFCLCVPLFSVATFLPQIVARFGFDAVTTNLYTVAPNVVGSVFVVLLAFSSDRFGERCAHIAAALCATAAGFVVLCAVDVDAHFQVGYFACFLICVGGFVTSPLWSSWFSNNTPDENQRAILTPTLVAIANCGAFVSSNIFTEASAPRYRPASITNLVCGFLGAVITLGLGLWMKLDNNRRNREQGVVLRAGDVPTRELQAGHRDPRWRWMGGVL
ncbi:major facilitator superfamily domain-containing protein [Xylariomycetidae sp. FL0641]|nr:major facilitator superfamily domain-containing protein [Xylariomycetidae sp. FL0641]